MDFTITYAHLKESKVKAGQLVNKGTEIGTMGNTGIYNTAAHLHIDCVEGIRTVRDYTLTDIYNGDPKSSKTQLDYFIGDDLFNADYRITTDYNELEYFNMFGWNHPAYDIVPKSGDWTIYYNRGFTGRVVYSGYNKAYGNHVMIWFNTLDFDKQVEEEPIESHENDLGSLYINGDATLYSMVNKNAHNYEYGQVDDLRYIKVHPDNFGIVVGKNRISDVEYSGVNGSFFWYTSDNDLYATGILKIKDLVLQGNSNHTPHKQSVLCYYQDGTLGIEIVNSVNELSKPTWWAIGGVGLYDKDAEGFTGAYADIWRKTNHTSIGYDAEGYIYLVRSYNVERTQTVEHMKKLGCIGYMGLDSGGSCQIKTEDWKRPTIDSMCRKVHTLLVAIK